MTDQISADFWCNRRDVEPLMSRLVDVLENCHEHLTEKQDDEDADMIAEIIKGIDEAYETGVLDNRPRGSGSLNILENRSENNGKP